MKNHQKSPVFGKKGAKSAFFMQFWHRIGALLRKMQKSPFLAKSLLELFEFYSIRGRVISDRHWPIKQKTANQLRGVRS